MRVSPDFCSKTAAGLRIIAVWVGLVVLLGSAAGFRCHCPMERGRVSGARTLAFVVWPQRIPGPPEDEFSPLEDMIFLSVDYENLEPESELRARWYYLGEEGERADEPKLFEVGLSVVESSGTAYFAVRRKGKIWPTGRYRAIVELNDEEVDRADFEIFSRTEHELELLGPPSGEGGGGDQEVPVFSSEADRVGCRVTALNPEPDTRLRVMWHRKEPNGEKPRFYAESDELEVERSGRLTFILPKPKEGYCGGRYRVSLLVGGKRVAEKRFELTPTKSASARAAPAQAQ
jgi:hypothetical protein